KDQRLTNHTNLIACDFHTDNGMMHLTGTVYARDIYRLIEFSDYRVDADLADSLLIVENDDVPGIIGKVGTLLADKNINISHVSSGRNKESGKAVNIFNTDEKIDADLQATLADTPNIHSALVVQLDS
ncbi:MAG: ACT domain-containing protein, partial [Calditrichota bacterium]